MMYFMIFMILGTWNLYITVLWVGYSLYHFGSGKYYTYAVFQKTLAQISQKNSIFVILV